MCGIAGIWNPEATTQELDEIARRMADAIRHRGPDGSGIWHDSSSGLALCHRRLAIVDLSDAGHQPMMSVSGRYVMSFNGEIYNFQSLRSELTTFGHRFRGHSDTEVMLAAFEQWGIDASLQKFNGMFAFAVWDKSTHELHLARDRLGKKPVYYCTRGRLFAFASELKSLREIRDASFRIDREALVQYLRFQYVPAPRSIFEDVSKLLPAEVITVATRGSSFSVSKRTYWSPVEVYATAAADPWKGNMADAERELELLIEDSVRSRMVSDVPLGAFLSGGIDSSLVVAHMQRISSLPVRTFSIGFAEAAFDESEHASRVAAHLKTDHTQMDVDSAMALAVVPSMPQIYDEPFGDASGIPTFLVSKLARKHVTVALSGDGGDELFCGYTRYRLWRRLWPLLRAIPADLRTSIGRQILKHDARQLDKSLAPLSTLLGREPPPRGRLVRRAAEALLAADAGSLYLQFVSNWQNPEALVLGVREPRTVLHDAWPRGLDRCTTHMSLLDILTYLPEDILVKVDRATMATSLEARCPLLDYRLVEFAARLPMSCKIARGQGKVILRSALYRHVPQTIVDRPKMGFGIPLADWLRGPLRDWAESLVDERRLRSEGLLDAAVVRRAWSAFVERGENFQFRIWTLLMFESWLDAWSGRVCPVEDWPTVTPSLAAERSNR